MNFLTPRIEQLFSVWLKELNSTQRIEPFKKYDAMNCHPLFQYDSKNWIFLRNVSKNWTFFFLIWLKESFKKEKWLKELNLFLKYDSKNWFFWIWHKELNLFSFDEHDSKISFIGYDSELNFLITTHRIDFYFDSKIFFEHDSKNSPFFIWLWELNFFLTTTLIIELVFSDMILKIEPFIWIGLKESNPFFWVRLKESNFFFFETKLSELHPFLKRL